MKWKHDTCFSLSTLRPALLLWILLFGQLGLRSSPSQMMAAPAFQLLGPNPLESSHRKSSWLYLHSVSRIQPLLIIATAAPQLRVPIISQLDSCGHLLSALPPFVYTWHGSQSEPVTTQGRPHHTFAHGKSKNSVFCKALQDPLLCWVSDQLSSSCLFLSGGRWLPVSQASQVHSCPRALALAVYSVCNTLPLDNCLACTLTFFGSWYYVTFSGRPSWPPDLTAPTTTDITCISFCFTFLHSSHTI